MLDSGNEGGDCGDRADIVARRGRDALAQMQHAATVERRSLDFGAAEVDADAQRRHPSPAPLGTTAPEAKKRGAASIFPETVTNC